MEEMKYEIKGITLNVFDIQKIHEYYEAYCTAEYLVDNYKIKESKALRLGYAIRALMQHKDICEEEAIMQTLKEHKIEVDNG